MKIVKITIGNNYEQLGKGLTNEQYKEKVAAFFTDSYLMSGPHQSDKEFLVTQDMAVDAFAHFGVYDFYTGGVKSISKVFDEQEEQVQALHNVLSRLQIASATLEAQTAAGISDRPSFHADVPGWNNKAGSPISGPVLHSFNDLMLCEDCCTDHLQEKLDEGWRVIAVCPMESRRPDYVLGRYVEVRANYGRGAAR